MQGNKQQVLLEMDFELQHPDTFHKDHAGAPKISSKQRLPAITRFHARQAERSYLLADKATKKSSSGYWRAEKPASGTEIQRGQ
jgi:hypothetical protein